jgi:hypothetical protein
MKIKEDNANHKIEEAVRLSEAALSPYSCGGAAEIDIVLSGEIQNKLFALELSRACSYL